MSRIHVTVSRVALAAGTVVGALAFATGLGVAQTVVTSSVPLSEAIYNFLHAGSQHHTFNAFEIAANLRAGLPWDGSRYNEDWRYPANLRGR